MALGHGLRFKMADLECNLTLNITFRPYISDLMSLIEPSYILMTYSKSYMAPKLVPSNLTFDLNIDL